MYNVLLLKCSEKMYNMEFDEVLISIEVEVMCALNFMLPRKFLIYIYVITESMFYKQKLLCPNDNIMIYLQLHLYATLLQI